MNRDMILKVVGGIVGTLVLIVVLFVGFVMLSMSGVEPMGEYTLADGKVEIVIDGYTSMVVLDVDDGVVVVDAGNDPEGEALLAELAERGLGKDAVKAFLITHGHGDHVAALPLFPDAKIYSSREEVDLIEGRVAAGGPLPRWMPPEDRGVKVTPFKRGEILEIGGMEVETHFIPGHTKGSVAYIAHGVLIMGDSAAAVSPTEVAPAPWIFSTSVDDNRRSIISLGKKLKPRKLEISDTIYSHSGPHQGIDALTSYDQPPPTGT